MTVLWPVLRSDHVCQSNDLPQAAELARFGYDIRLALTPTWIGRRFGLAIPWGEAGGPSPSTEKCSGRLRQISGKVIYYHYQSDNRHPTMLMR